MEKWECKSLWCSCNAACHVFIKLSGPVGQTITAEIQGRLALWLPGSMNINDYFDVCGILGGVWFGQMAFVPAVAPRKRTILVYQFRQTSFSYQLLGQGSPRKPTTEKTTAMSSFDRFRVYQCLRSLFWTERRELNVRMCSGDCCWSGFHVL